MLEVFASPAEQEFPGYGPLSRASTPLFFALQILGLEQERSLAAMRSRGRYDSMNSRATVFDTSSRGVRGIVCVKSA